MSAFNMILGYDVKNSSRSFLNAELQRDGNSIFAASESDDKTIVDAMLTTPRPTMSYGINFDNDEELYNAYSMPIKDGPVLRPSGPLPWSPSTAGVIDRYGVCWYIYVSQLKPD
jgi:PhnB protein